MIRYDSSHPDYKPSWDQWGLRVDAEGVPVPKGQEGDSDRFARPPIEFKYGGTVSILPNNMTHRYPRFKPVISTDEQCEENKRQTLQMMFVLAQTPARALMEIFNTANMELIIHPGLTSAEGTNAICDSTAKSLYFHPRVPRNPKGFGCAAHELRHEEKNQPISEYTENGIFTPKLPGFLYDHTDTLGSAIATADIQEPDANMMSAYVRASFIFDQPGDHPLRWKPPGYETLFDVENPKPYHIALKESVMKAGHYLEEGRPEKFMREIFLFERANSDSLFYHRKALQVFLEYATPPIEGCKGYETAKKLFDERMENFMQVDYVTPEVIRRRFPYLENSDVLELCKPVLHPDSEVRTAYAKLQAQIESLGDVPKHKPNLEIALEPIEATPVNRMADRLGTSQPHLKQGWITAHIGQIPVSVAYRQMSVG